MLTNEYSDSFYNKQKCSGGSRTPSEISCVVIHDTEGTTASGGAHTLTTRTDASTQLVCDDSVTYRIVPELTVPCGVRDVNSWTLHIEQAGIASWSERTWRTKVKTIQRAAFWTAFWMKKFDIPAHFLTTPEINAGKRKGYTSHNNLSLSSVSSSTHTDPGPNYPWALFRNLLAFYRLGFRLGLVKGPRKVA